MIALLIACVPLGAASASDDVTVSHPRFELASLPPGPFENAPAAMTAAEPETELAPAMIVGAASMYDPTDPDDEDAGGLETASGETYDPGGWTAAIQTGLRMRFAGVRYRMRYEPTYALVEIGDQRAVVRINDVDPLRPGRIIDLNRQAMLYFDPSLKRGVLDGVRVTVLAGRHWAPGPVEDGDNNATLTAQASLASR